MTEKKEKKGLQRVYFLIASFSLGAVLPRLILAISDAEDLKLSLVAERNLIIGSVLAMAIATTFSQLALSHYMGQNATLSNFITVGVAWLGSVVAVAIVVGFHILASLSGAELAEVLHQQWLIDNKGLVWYTISWVLSFDLGPTALIFCAGRINAKVLKKQKENEKEEEERLIKKLSSARIENVDLKKSLRDYENTQSENDKLKRIIEKYEKKVYGNFVRNPVVVS